MASAIEAVRDAASSGMEKAKTIGESFEPNSQRSASLSTDDRAIMSEVRMIGGALVAIVIVALVLTEVYDAVEIDSESPFHGIVESAETTGVAAITLLIVGLLVLAASVIMRFMGGSFAR